MPQTKLRRTQLPAPAKNRQMMEQALQSDADQVLLDLEDSVPPSEKVSSRKQLIDILQTETASDKTMSCRINAIDTQWWYNDLIEIVTQIGHSLDTILLPKADSAEHVHTLENLLAQVEKNTGLESGKIGIEVQIETARGMNNVIDITLASDRLESIVFGPGDYSASIGAGRLQRQRGDTYPGHYWHYPLSRMVHAGKGAGIQVIDGLYADIDDENGFTELCEWAKMLGCDGKWTIHPSQIAIANDVFAPSKDEAEMAKRIVEGHAQMQGDTDDIVTVDGEIVDEMTLRMAEDILRRARKAGVF